MKIALLGDSRLIHIRRWATGVAARGHDVDLVDFRAEVLERVRQRVLPLESRPGILHFPGNVRAVRKLLRRIRPDVVHGQPVVGHGFWAAASGVHPLVLSSWGSDLLIGFDQWKTRWTARYALRRADALICVAEHLRDRAVALGADPHRCHVIPMGVDLGSVPASTSSTSEPRIVSTRGLWPIYDLATLVRAVLLVRRSVPGVKVDLFGEGRERRNLERLAQELGVGDAIAFRGFRDSAEVIAALRRAAVYVTTAISDGASVSLMEAMAAGAFPVATDIPANRSWIAPGRNGLLFQAGDPRALAAAIVQALDDDGVRRRAAAENRAIIERRGDAAANLDRALQVYESVLRAGAMR